MIKIALLDTNTVNYGDIDFKDIEALGECVCANPKTDEEILAACHDCDVVIINKSVMTEAIISSLPKLKMIGLFATGYNNVDLESCRKHGVVCCNAPGYSTDAVAQHTFALLLSFVNALPHYFESVNDGYWIRCGQFSYYTSPMEELKGKTLGIYGLGNIGRRVAELGSAFGMNVIFVNRSPKEGTPYRQVRPEELFSSSDVISLHCPLNEETKDLINETTLALMKPNAILVNTSRGGLIDEDALASALREGRLGGACLDVLKKEPMAEDCPLYHAPRCFITPHVAWAPRQTRESLVKLVAGNIKAFLEGKPIHVVS